MHGEERQHGSAGDLTTRGIGKSDTHPGTIPVDSRAALRRFLELVKSKGRVDSIWHANEGRTTRDSKSTHEDGRRGTERGKLDHYGTRSRQSKHRHERSDKKTNLRD